ncbi:hypothetical protein GCM10010435_87760 [Winogradskya consettensis]|uniref:Tetratricopeptide repeat protein n=1 Tax=Winogradskya consettensis TaxID=113560 RepID=A0A919W5R9_9ACTN|nr:hypothetical protein [Actinoplanes consettensis]GIM80968.1 hypothetical protein Aco04nite_74040 [Actinoplanes consettensis]
MTMSEQQLTDLLHEVHRRPDGPARFTAWDALFRHADAAGATKFAFGARMSAISEFHHGGDPARAFLAFSWCLATADRQPELATSHQQHSLLWRFKWIVWALPQFPDIPLGRTVAVLDDMERRYRLAGHSLHAVYQHRWLVAHHVGDTAAAQEWYDKMLTAPQDSLADCHACVPSAQVRQLTSTGDHEEAIRIGSPWKQGGCSEQPQWMLAELLLPYLSTGRFDEAVDAHRVGYRYIREDRHHLDNVALHLTFLGRSGNEPAGLDVIEHHLSWLDRPSSPFAEMEFAAAAALVLGRLRDAGQGDLALRRRSDDGTRRWSSTVAETHDELAARASALAARFDARNGNTHQSSRIAARMTAPPLASRLPLTVLAGRAGNPRAGDPALAAQVEHVAALTAAGDLAGAARERLQVAYALRNADQWRDATEAAEEAVRSLDRAGLADDAVRGRYLLWELYQRSRGRRQAEAVLDAIGEAAHVPDDLPAYATLLEQAGDTQHREPAAQRFLAAADRHRTTRLAAAQATAPADQASTAADRLVAGGGVTVADRLVSERELSAAADELRTLWKAARCLSPSEEAREVIARAAQLIAACPGVPVAEIGRLHAVAAFNAERPEIALVRIALAVAAFGTAGAAGDLSAALVNRAELLLAAGRPAEAEGQARELLAGPDDDIRWDAAVVLVRTLRRQGRGDEARAVMDEYDLEEDYLED